MNSYSRYQSIKEQCQVLYSGIELKFCLAWRIIFHAYAFQSIKKTSVSFFFKQCRYSNVYKDLDTLFAKEKVVLSHAKQSRKDYYSLVENASKIILNSETFNYSVVRKKHNDLLLIMTTFLESLVSFRREFSFKQILTWTLITLEVKRKIRYLDSISNNIEISAFIAFNSSIQDDAILCCFLNKKNIPTFTMQHGHYLTYKDPPLDIINYENLTANKLLCWGRSTKENLKEFGIDSSRLMIFGNTKYLHNEFKKLNKPKFQKVLVLLGRYIHHDSNMSLLKLLNEISAQSNESFYLKLHPSLIDQGLSHFYNDFYIIDTLDFGSFDTAISNNTSAYFDARLNGLLCLRYGKYETENFDEEQFLFYDVKDYLHKKNLFLRENLNQLRQDNLTSLEQTFDLNFQENVSNLKKLISNWGQEDNLIK